MKQYTAQDILKLESKQRLDEIRLSLFTANFCYEPICSTHLKAREGFCYNLCACTDEFRPIGYRPAAFEECPNCFGYGRPPIPPGEVGL